MDNPVVWFQTKFSPQVTHRFREKGYSLRMCTTPGEHLGAQTFRFYLQARGRAVLRGGSGKYNFQNNALSSVDVSALTYDYAVKVRKDDVRRMSVNSVDAQSKAAAEGCGTTANQVVIDSMAALTLGAGLGNILAPQNLGGTGTPFRITDLIQTAERMDALGVPRDGNRWGYIPSRWWSIAAMSELFSSSDYKGETNGIPREEIRNFHTINWIMMPDEFFGTGADFVAHAWHKDAVGTATIDNGELRTAMNEIPDEPAYALVTDFDMATAALQANSIVRITRQAASAYPTATSAL